MDRAYVERLLANAVRPELHPVELPVAGRVYLRRPNREEATRVATAAGQDDDWMARAMVGALRFALVDETGQQLLRSLPEASALFNQLDDADLAVLLPELQSILAPPDDPADGIEAGKGR